MPSSWLCLGFASIQRRVMVRLAGACTPIPGRWRRSTKRRRPRRAVAAGERRPRISHSKQGNRGHAGIRQAWVGDDQAGRCGGG
jgi:hypothetical protein